ncbi:ABC transporter ATP-binding protein [Priestia koreensis]|uniref:ABC transporter ATP-binding protein n=1 Tax=Priestia koreensis TaxID=284581 RepID=UPI001F580535|nr:ABC transporter ATP-binding protein [Priestia koreensis]UNL86796.1 ABC transporter ATP-binding protein [Priestia koreensis]
MIKINQLSKNFNNGKGIFDLSFEVKKGEVFGFLGPNGAGKSTTIRNLIGFTKPTSGEAFIGGFNCWTESDRIQKITGYLPGEIAFIDNMNGLQFLKLIGDMKGIKDTMKRDELIRRLQFDVKTPIRKMSKGMKQKVGIVAAFMHQPEVLILDEPTSGLDPLMQQIFIELVLEEKRKGTTILMSSHMFQEVEKTCDRVAIIKDGKLVSIENVHDLRTHQRKVIEVTADSQESIAFLRKSNLLIENISDLTASIVVQGDYNNFIQILSCIGVMNIQVRNMDLEDLFMHYYNPTKLASTFNKKELIAK